MTSIQASHAQVFKIMEVIVNTHLIPWLGTLTQAKTKKQFQQELDSYFDELMRTVTSPDMPISADDMRKYVVGSTILKTMIHMLMDELDRGARAVYPNSMEARYKFQTDVTVEHMDTLKDYQSWHQYATIDQHEDVEKLDFYGFLSPNDAYFYLSKPFFTCVHVYCVESCQM